MRVLDETAIGSTVNFGRKQGHTKCSNLGRAEGKQGTLEGSDFTIGANHVAVVLMKAIE